MGCFLDTLENNIEDDSMLQTNFVITTLNGIWPSFYFNIVVTCFIPFVVYFFVTLYYVTVTLGREFGLP